jgi:hypothetical protein
LKRQGVSTNGGAGAGRALRLAAFWGVGLLGVSGCGKILPAAKQHSVQMDRLVPLHPAYSQIAMQREIVGGVERQAGALSLPKPQAQTPLPPAFAAGELIPPNLASEREERVALDSRRYLALLEDSLTRRNAGILEREERAGRKQIEVEVEAERTKREQALREQYAQERAAIQSEKRPLEFRRVALESQRVAFTGMTKSDANLQLGTVTQRIAALDKRLQDRDDRAVPAIVADRLKPFIAKQNEELAHRLQNRRRRLEDEVEGRLKRERLRLASEADAIPDLRASVMPPSTPSDRPIAPVVAAGSEAYTQTKPRLDTAIVQAQSEQNAERLRLLSVLRADTQKAVEQVAVREGWKLVPVGTRGATDITAHAADALREQWK